MNIPLSNPDITEKEKQAVLEVLNTPNLSLGPKLEEFENKFSEKLGTKFAIATNSGTSGLHLCIRALGLEEEDEVITTPFSFVASANCLLIEKVKPLFVDIDKESLNLDINKLEDTLKGSRKNGSNIKAILPVHIFGRPCEMEPILDLAKRFDLRIIEDACEAIGAEYRIESQPDDYSWLQAGSMGDCGVFAFYPNKQITTGEGGMIVTDNEKIYRLCRSMRNQGRAEDGAWLQHQRLGFNYRISDINCALGIVQLERLDEILQKRSQVASWYNQRLAMITELTIPLPKEDQRISWFVYVVRLADRFSRKNRDDILQQLRNRGISCSNYFSPIHLQPFYRKLFGHAPGDFPVTENASERTLALPFYNNISEDQVDLVCQNLENIIQKL